MPVVGAAVVERVAVAVGDNTGGGVGRELRGGSEVPGRRRTGPGDRDAELQRSRVIRMLRDKSQDSLWMSRLSGPGTVLILLLNHQHLSGKSGSHHQQPVTVLMVSAVDPLASLH